MTADLAYLSYTALLTASLWIPYVVCQVMTNGPLQPGNYRDPTPRPVPLWGKRAERVYLNAIEVFASFAVLVILVHMTGKSSDMTIFWTKWFFWVRLVHAVVYWFAIPFIRTLAFTAGFVAVIGVFWQLVK